MCKENVYVSRKCLWNEVIIKRIKFLLLLAIKFINSLMNLQIRIRSYVSLSLSYFPIFIHFSQSPFVSTSLLPLSPYLSISLLPLFSILLLKQKLHFRLFTEYQHNLNYNCDKMCINMLHLPYDVRTTHVNE